MIGLKLVVGLIGSLGCFFWADIPEEKITLVILSKRSAMISYNFKYGKYKGLWFKSMKLKLSPGKKTCRMYMGYLGYGQEQQSKICFPNVSTSFKLNNRIYAPRNEDGINTELILFYINISTLQMDSITVNPQIIFAPD